MAKLVLELEDAVVDYWRELARSASISVENWLLLCGVWGSALGLPVTRLILRQPSAQRAQQGVAWEILQLPRPGGPSMSAFNTSAYVFLIGNVARFTVKQRVAFITVATHRNSKSGAEQIQLTDYHHVVAFDPQRGIVEDLLAKGQKVFVLGRLEYSTDPRLQHTYTRILCQTINILAPPSEHPSGAPVTELAQPDAGTSAITPPAPAPPADAPSPNEPLDPTA